MAGFINSKEARVRSGSVLTSYLFILTIGLAAGAFSGCRGDRPTPASNPHVLYYFFMFEDRNQSTEINGASIAPRRHLVELSADSLREIVSAESKPDADSLDLVSSYVILQGNRIARLFRNASGDGFVVAANPVVDSVELKVCRRVDGRYQRVLESSRVGANDIVIMREVLGERSYVIALQAKSIDLTTERGVSIASRSRERFLETLRQLHPVHALDLIPEELRSDSGPCDQS